MQITIWGVAKEQLMGSWPFTNDSDRKALARKSYNAKNYKKAEPYLKKMIKKNPNDKWALDVLSRLYINTERHEKSIPLCQKLFSLTADSKFVQRMIDCAIKSGKHELAKDSIAQIELNIEDEKRFVSVVYSMKDLQERETFLEDLVAQNPETDYIRRILVEHHASKLHAMGETISAINCIESISLENTDEKYRLAQLYSKTGDQNQTIKICDEILSENSNHRKAIILKLQNGVKIWPLDKVRKQVKHYIEQNEKIIQLYRIIINVEFSGEGDYNKALYYCDLALQLDPNDRRFSCSRAQCLSKLSRHEEAFLEVEQLMSKSPSSDEVFLTKAQIRKASGDGGGMILAINEMLAKHELAPIQSVHENQDINIEYLSCDASLSKTNEFKVSVIMTMYKKDPLLDIAIESILKQTHRNIELIVVDDKSPDDAFEYVKNKEKQDPRLRVFQMERNGGTYRAKNFGLTKVTGDYIAFMDSDDWSHPQRVEKQLKLLIENPDAMATTQNYFRIDENSHIPYRGNGSVRMACISLLMKKEVQLKMGYFDSLRVGADSEYIERIMAIFGNKSVINDESPTLFVTYRNASLSGGGEFHISWRSISGDRNAHHSAFREWHRKISSGAESGFVERILRLRPYEVPDSMKAEETSWREDSYLFSERIHNRHSQWWREGKEISAKFLSSKMKGREYVAELGLKVPNLYWVGKDASQIPSLKDLPSRVVIKPEKGWSAKNVWCLIEGVNKFDGIAYTDQMIQEQLAQDEFIQKQKPFFMVEEFLAPEKTKENPIPCDYKFYCFGSKIALIHVVDRKSTNNHLNVNHCFDENFKPIKHKVYNSITIPNDYITLPDCFSEMVEAVEKIGATLGLFMRIDMYATNKGAVFGEFTPTPHGGKGFTEWADKYLGSFWKG
ncbi:MAG: glycosyltransferase, partial [Fidelibacterota bacterium]